MKNVEHSDNRDLNHLKLFFYLIPIIGFFPSLWTLYHQGNQSRGGLGSPLGRIGVPSGDEGRRGEEGVGEQECQDRREQLALSRLSVTLSGCWLLGYFLLGIGAESEFFKLRFLMLNTLLTSGYFLVSIWLIFRLSSGKSTRLPGFSRLAERVGKHLV